MHRHLVFFVHFPQTYYELYASAIRNANPGVRVDTATISLNGLSSVYQRYAQGQTVESLRARHLPLADIRARYDTVSFISWSAGYALVREILTRDSGSVDMVCLIDSLHGNFDPGAPKGISQATLQMWSSFAREAKNGSRIFYVANTDTKTPQRGPRAYPSTAQMSEALIDSVGLPANGFRVSSWNIKEDDAEEHKASLTVWGKDFAVDAFGALMRTTNAVLPWRDPSLTIGERCVEWALNEKANGVKEAPAHSNDSPRIREYLKHCIRRDTGLPLNISHTNWCAAFVSMAQRECLLEKEVPAHGYRAAVVELMADLKANSLWFPKSSLGSLYKPQRGDIVVYDRSVKGRPETSWWRHVCLMHEAPGGSPYTTIGGNEHDTISVTGRDFNDTGLIGFGRRAHVTPPPPADIASDPLDDPELANLDNLITLSLQQLIDDLKIGA